MSLNYYLDPDSKGIMHCDPAEAPIHPAWVVVSEADVPVLQARYASVVPPSEKLLQTIAALEAAITPRRIRESILGIDGGWLAATDSAIAAARGELSQLRNLS